jgi:DNA repair exonuclease SbcCD ATPase subunit
MLLNRLQIENYKCIDDSGEFSTPSVTCLVGKNESGKSAVLQALYRLNPVEKEAANFDELEEYPRKNLTDYEAIKDKDPANVLTTTWELEEKDVSAIEERFGVFPLKDKTVIVTKGYSNKRDWVIQTNEEILFKYCLKQLGSASDTIEGNSVKTLAELISQLENIKEPSEEQSKVLSYIKEKIPGGDAEQALRNFLATLLPTFLYFPEYEKMAGRVSFTLLQEHISQNKLKFSEKIFLALLDLAGTSPTEIQQLGRLEHLIAKLEGVSNKLTQEIFEYWSQNEYLRVNFRFEAARPQDEPPFNTGHVFMTRIENTRHQVSVGFEDRSSGFVWFFSFLAWFLK